MMFGYRVGGHVDLVACRVGATSVFRCLLRITYESVRAVSPSENRHVGRPHCTRIDAEAGARSPTEGTFCLEVGAEWRCEVLGVEVF
jgi:hypothetical protein